MKAKGTIVIQGKEYSYSFKMKARRLFMEHYNLEYFEDYQEKVNLLVPEKGKQMGVSGWYVFANLLLTAIQSETDEELIFGADEILDELMEDQKKIEQITDFFLKSQEQNTTKNSSVGVGKSRKRR